ncbi:zinc finger and SCAN domain-containing protein 2-like [Branchiostoma floridae]|uniref:Zinc finger and SCAN domain-containing protein 2-like n=1 Tax=Branchiostoma floridae TaxID=7739 RepID=A0A9J7HTC7_BRAFL|nr:zinc finger and SCAN domain-containing protein 2-like [Branchiostoma floridae]
MADFTCVSPVKELHVEQTLNETHIKEEPTGDTGWQQDGQENVLCQKTYSEDQETYNYQNETKLTGYPWSENYNSWEQIKDTGRQQDEETTVPNDETCGGVRAEMEESSCGFFSVGEHPGKEMGHSGQPGKESDSRETQTTDMGLQQETCDVKFPQPDNTSTSQVQESRGSIGRLVVKHTVEKPYMCGKSRKSNFNRHITEKHSDEKPYMCEECGYFTANRTLTSIDTYENTSEKPFMCGECGYRVAHKSTLSVHMKTRHYS